MGGPARALARFTGTRPSGKRFSWQRCSMATPYAGRRLLIATTTVLASFALVLSGTSPATARGGDRDSHPRPARTVALPNGFRPEGIASGPGRTYYAGSMADGRIVTGDLRRGTSTVLL